jgi:hypothetical protein
MMDAVSGTIFEGVRAIRQKLSSSSWINLFSGYFIVLY